MAEACCSCLGQLRHVELRLLSVQKKGAVVCGGGCEDKGAMSEFHRMSEYCQSSSFYPLPLLITFPQEKSAVAWRSLCCRRESGVLQKDAKPYSLPGEKGNDKVLLPI